MSVQRKHVEFEEAVHRAFPTTPLPVLDSWKPQSWLERDAKDLFSNKTWPEVVGFRLLNGELDLNLVIWMDALPPSIFDYYVPSHLILASLLLPQFSEPNYLQHVQEAFVLPPSRADASLAEIDTEFSLDAPIVDDADPRIAFYRRATPEQRACVGGLLDLYLAYRGKAELSARGIVLFEQNRDYWLHSSWAPDQVNWQA